MTNRTLYLSILGLKCNITFPSYNTVDHKWKEKCLYCNPVKIKEVYSHCQIIPYYWKNVPFKLSLISQKLKYDPITSKAFKFRINLSQQLYGFFLFVCLRFFLSGKRTISMSTCHLTINLNLRGFTTWDITPTNKITR